MLHLCFLFSSKGHEIPAPPMRKGKFPSLRCGTVSSKEPKFETILSSAAVNFGRQALWTCGLRWPGENNRLSPRHKEAFKPESYNQQGEQPSWS